MSKEEPPKENILRALLRMRMPIEEDTRAGRMRDGNEVVVGVMTRLMV